MDFKEVSYIVAIAKEGTLSKAAEKLYISQPALSRFLQRTEAFLGVSLFTSIGKKMIPTYAGEKYIEMAKRVLLLKDDFEKELDDIKDLKTGKLSVGLSSGRGKIILGKVLPVFCKKYPQFEVKTYLETAEKLEQFLLDGKVQLIEYTVDKDEHFAYNKMNKDIIAQEEIILVTSKKRHIRGTEKDGFYRPWADLKKLEGERFLLLYPGSRLRSKTDHIFHELGLNPTFMEFTSIDTIWELVRQGFGIALGPEFNCQVSSNSCDYFSIGNNGIRWEFVAAYRNESYLSKQAKDFIEITKYFWGNNNHHCMLPQKSIDK